MTNIHLLSVAYDNWAPDKSKRGSWRVTTANKVIEEILKHTPHARVTRMYNDDARYDSIRAYLDGLVGQIGSEDIFWFQYNGHGSNLVGYEPISLIDNWDGKGALPFTGENVLMYRQELLEKIARIGGFKLIVMDSCCADIDEAPPNDTIYVAAAGKDTGAHGDLSTGVVHPTLSRYGIPEIVSTGIYRTWDGLEFEFGEHSIVRANIQSPQFRVTGQHELPRGKTAQEFYEAMTGETGKIMMRFLPRPTIDPAIYRLFEKDFGLS